MDKPTSTAPAGWARGVSGTFTLDGKSVDLATLDRRATLSPESVAAIRRLPVGALLELDADRPGEEALLRRVA